MTIAASSPPLGRSFPRWQCLGLLALDAGMMAATATQAVGGWRVVLALAFSSLVPGSAILAHRSPTDGATRLALVVAISWTVMVLLNDGLLELGWWNPQLSLIVLGLVCGASLAGRAAQPVDWR